MEEFYALLKSYNDDNLSKKHPDWAKIFSETGPPIYWNVIADILSDYSKDSRIFEIGAGAGDILALIRSIGFNDVTGIERNKDLAYIANKKIDYFFQKHNTVIQGNYPLVIPRPNILVQVNCVYFENIFTKQDYLFKLKLFYENACPDIYLLEVIDSSFREKSKAFPSYVRLSLEDIQRTFQDKRIQSYITYQHPKNTSTKRLYLIA